MGGEGSSGTTVGDFSLEEGVWGASGSVGIEVLLMERPWRRRAVLQNRGCLLGDVALLVLGCRWSTRVALHLPLSVATGQDGAGHLSGVPAGTMGILFS